MMIHRSKALTRILRINAEERGSNPVVAPLSALIRVICAIRVENIGISAPHQS
jgi:hypothetical protein